MIAVNEAEAVVKVQNVAGESPRWDADSGTLVWADIVDPHLLTFNPATGESTSVVCPVPVTGIGLRESGGLVLASKTGLYLTDAAFSDYQFLTDPEADHENVRFNDGMVDRRGRYWAGTLNEVDFSATDGALYRLDPDLTLHTMDTGLKGPNGIGWSPDDRTMYLVDSFAQVIYRYDFDPVTGTPTHRTLLVEVPAADGMPDGLTVDREGFLWMGHWGGGRVTRFDPDGRVDLVLRLPVANVTACMFGGPDLADLYITSAWFLLNDEDRVQQPRAGDVFRARPGVTGLPEPKFLG